ncbi:hypothetical protein [Gloeobacter violaceus]|uniref:hypothetical protein n=1 Tax=Gloeobacter violaceus TaxID=33072 RepID=UPI0018D4C46F|nr:hypothetical protein [Gloeobacter violaceus]
MNIAVEDLLSEAVLRSLLSQIGREFIIPTCYGLRGADYLKQRLIGFNNAAKAIPYLVVVDLDAHLCPLALLRNWQRFERHPNFLFRIAVKEIEAWILADRESFAKWLGVLAQSIPEEVDSIPKPKEFLVSLAKKSNRRNLREDLVPAKGSIAKVGKGYNAVLSEFVSQHWKLTNAVNYSPSLMRAKNALVNFQPST